MEVVGVVKMGVGEAVILSVKCVMYFGKHDYGKF